jgi:hypothetical protein
MSQTLGVRVCERCGKPRGVFEFALIRTRWPRRGYWHPRCFILAKKEAENDLENDAPKGDNGNAGVPSLLPR